MVYSPGGANRYKFVLSVHTELTSSTREGGIRRPRYKAQLPRTRLSHGRDSGLVGTTAGQLATVFFVRLLADGQAQVA